MASGRLAAVELNKNISQSIYVCPTDDVTTVTLNVVNRRNDGIKISVALTDTLNADITDLNDATIYPLELEVPIAPKGVMERTQILVPSGKYLTLLTDEDFVTATAWGIEVGNAADPVPTPVTTNLGPTPSIAPLTLTVFDDTLGVAQLTTDYETGGLITYSVDSGTLPTGVELSETGVIQGSPTGSDGDYTFTVTATTRTGVSTTQDITVKKVTTSGGDEVYTYRDADNIDYRVHYFKSAGDFINTGDLEVDVFMVAGGGGGGSHAAPGGGGAGGLIYRPNLTLAAATNTVQVGAGGTGSYNPGSYGGMPNATVGGDSIFDDGNGYVLTAKGGGFGSSWSQDARSGEGGSGGGGANDISGHVVTGNQTSQAGDSGLYGYGNDGVNNTDGGSQNHGGGGGGGAGSAAVDPADRSIAGRGGEGLYFGDKFGDDVGDSGWFASGGCGGKWGSNGITSLLEPHPGGGGRGDSPTGAGTGGSELRSGSGEPTGEDGMSYTGGGGGGAGRTGGSSSRGGDGGSGAVLVRYPLNKFVSPFPIPLYNPADPVPSNSFFGSQVATSGIYTAVRYHNQSYSDTHIAVYNSNSSSKLYEIPAPISGEFAARMVTYGVYLLTGISDEKAYVYDMSTGNQVYEFTNPNPAGTTSFDFYGARGLSMDDRYAVVGSPSEDVGGSNTGSVYVYDMTDGSFLYRLDGTGGSFGHSTAIVDDQLIVGAWSALDGGGFSQGEAYVYNIADGTPVRTISTIDTDATPNDEFARNIQANSSYIVISASKADDDGTNSGRVYVYDTTTGNLLHTLTNPNRLGTVDNDQFGSTLSLNNDLLAVGSADGGSASGNGTVYLFDLSGPTITYREIANPDLLDTTTADYFGFEEGTVALSSTHLVVGAPRAESATVVNEGNAFIYKLSQVLSDFSPTDV